MASNQQKNHVAFKAQDEAQFERQFLKGTKDEDLGVYCDIFSAKSSFKGQDGGVVTALLSKGFEEGLFDAAVVVRRIEGYNAEAVVAYNAADVATASGTKYLRVNVTGKLRELIDQGKKRIAIVCTPCEVKAARKIQQTLRSECNLTIIGLFCFEAFNHERLKEEIQRRLGVDIDGADKTQVRQGRFRVDVSGNTCSCRVKELDNAAEKACGFCDDFTSRFADVSVGSTGSGEGYSTVIVRSKVGEELVGKLDAQKEAANKAEVARLAKLKLERAEKRFADRKQAV